MEEEKREILFESTLPEPFPVCGRYSFERDAYCDSTAGVVIRFGGFRGIGIYCGGPERHLRPTQYISHLEFMPGGRYAHAKVPQELLSPSATKKRQNAYKPSENARAQAFKLGKCLICRVSPCKRYTPRAIIFWLKAYDRELHHRIEVELGSWTSALNIADQWNEMLPELWGEALQRAENSELQADHLFPVVLLEHIREKISPVAFTYGAKALIVPLCGSCNRGRKIFVLEEPEIIEDRYIEFFFEGKPALAKSSKYNGNFRELLTMCTLAADKLRSQKSLGA